MKPDQALFLSKGPDMRDLIRRRSQMVRNGPKGYTPQPKPFCKSIQNKSVLDKS